MAEHAKGGRAGWLAVGGLIATLAAVPAYFVLMDVPSVRATAWPTFLLMAVGALGGIGAALRRPRWWTILIGSGNCLVLVLSTYAFFVMAALPTPGSVPGEGTSAPGFTLLDQNGRSVALADQLAGGPVLLVFYRGHW